MPGEEEEEEEKPHIYNSEASSITVGMPKGLVHIFTSIDLEGAVVPCSIAARSAVYMG